MIDLTNEKTFSLDFSVNKDCRLFYALGDKYIVSEKVDYFDLKRFLIALDKALLKVLEINPWSIGKITIPIVQEELEKSGLWAEKEEVQGNTIKNVAGAEKLLLQRIRSGSFVIEKGKSIPYIDYKRDNEDLTGELEEFENYAFFFILAQSIVSSTVRTAIYRLVLSQLLEVGALRVSFTLLNSTELRGLWIQSPKGNTPAKPLA